MRKQEKRIINAFNDLYYNGLKGEDQIFKRTYWMNVPCFKCPSDLWIYQEIIAEIQPDLIIETGKHMGGSALFMAHMLDIVGKGEIIKINVVKKSRRTDHPRIKYVTVSSADPDLIQQMQEDRPAEI